MSKLSPVYNTVGFPGGLVVKNLPAIAGDVSSIPGFGKSPGPHFIDDGLETQKVTAQNIYLALGRELD